MNDQFNTAQTRTGAATYDEGLRSYMIGVYNYMALGLAATALFSFWLTSMPAVASAMRGMFFVPFIGIIAMGFIGPKLIFSGSRPVAHLMFWLQVAIWGFAIGPAVAMFVGAGMATMVYKAFFMAAAMFGALSLYGYTTKRDLSGLGKILMMAGVGLILLIVAHFIFPSANPMISLVLNAAILAYTGFVTIWETQTIKRLYTAGGGEANTRASILGSFMLYSSFAMMFWHLLNMLNILGE